MAPKVEYLDVQHGDTLRWVRKEANRSRSRDISQVIWLTDIGIQSEELSYQRTEPRKIGPFYPEGRMVCFQIVILSHVLRGTINVANDSVIQHREHWHFCMFQFYKTSIKKRRKQFGSLIVKRLGHGLKLSMHIQSGFISEMLLGLLTEYPVQCTMASTSDLLTTNHG